MTLQAKLICLLATMLLGFGSGFGVRAYIASKDSLAAQVITQRAQLDAARDYERKVDERDKANQILNDKLHTLDVTSTRNLNEQLAENDRLRSDLGAAQRMRFNGAVCPQLPTASGTGTSGSVGAGTSVGLTDAARQTVLDIRAGIIRDQAKAKYLKDYYRSLGLIPTPPHR